MQRKSGLTERLEQFSLIAIAAESTFPLVLIKIAASIHEGESMNLPIRAIALALLASLPVKALADPERSFGVPDRLTGEDPSCDQVNRSYERTANTSRYTIFIKQWRVDGTAVPYLQEWLSPTNDIIDFSDGRRTISRRFQRLTVLDGSAQMRSCIFMGTVQTIYGKADHYGGEWQRKGWKAHIDIWTSVATGKFLQISRNFTGLPSPYPFAISVEAYAYPGSGGPDPAVQESVIPMNADALH